MPAKKKGQKPKTSGKYKGIIISFISLAVILFLFIIYYSFSKTMIYISPKLQTIENTFNIVVKENPSEEDKLEASLIEGVFLEREIEGTKTSTDLGETQEVPDKAEGKVTIYNNWTQVQPLAATTRLLSESGILFRTKERVDVPAKSSIEAEVYADEEGAQGNIGPSKFTIPGLSSQMQELVYAESTENMTGGIRKVKKLTQDMVLKVQNELISELEDQALSDLTKEAQEKNEDFSLTDDRVTSEIISKTIDPEIGSEAESLSLDLKIKLIAIAFSENELQEATKNKLLENLSSDLKLLDDKFTLSYIVENFNLQEKTATLKVSASGTTHIKLSSSIFNRDNLINKDRQEITAYFSDFETIESVEVKFSPFWVFKAPALKDHIEIKFK